MTFCLHGHMDTNYNIVIQFEFLLWIPQDVHELQFFSVEHLSVSSFVNSSNDN